MQQVDNNNMVILILLKSEGARIYHQKFQRAIRFTRDPGIDHGVIHPQMMSLSYQVKSILLSMDAIGLIMMNSRRVQAQQKRAKREEGLVFNPKSAPKDKPDLT